MSHINYNHLYYFWHVYKEGSVVGAAEALYLTPQTITGQIKALEERLQGKLFKRKGRGLEPSELGELVFRYADKMFTLSQEMLDIVNYPKSLTCCLMSAWRMRCQNVWSAMCWTRPWLTTNKFICAVLNPPMRCCLSSLASISWI